jgi:hypothetical protein
MLIIDSLSSELSANCIRGNRHGGAERTATRPSRTSRAVLPETEAARFWPACGHGSQRTLALVRALAAGFGVFRQLWPTRCHAVDLGFRHGVSWVDLLQELG